MSVLCARAPPTKSSKVLNFILFLFNSCQVLHERFVGANFRIIAKGRIIRYNANERFIHLVHCIYSSAREKIGVISECSAASAFTSFKVSSKKNCAIIPRFLDAIYAKRVTSTMLSRRKKKNFLFPKQLNNILEHPPTTRDWDLSRWVRSNSG